MANAEGRERARLAVLAAIAARRWTNHRLAVEAGVDVGTVGTFLAGKRWPSSPTRGRIESALGWPTGTIASIEAGAIESPDEQDRSESRDALTYQDMGTLGPRLSGVERQLDLLWQRVEQLEHRVDGGETWPHAARRGQPTRRRQRHEQDQAAEAPDPEGPEDGA